MNSSYVVAKFGGTSVADFESMKRCAQIIKNNSQVRLVAVSASAGVTNHLVSLCQNDLKLTQRNEHIEQVCNIQNSILKKLSLDKDIADGFNQTLNKFKNLARNINPTEKEKDSLLSFGERLSSYLFTQVLRGVDIDAVRLDARNVLKTDSKFGKATPNICATKKAASANLTTLLSTKVLVTQGFIGSISKVIQQL